MGLAKDTQNYSCDVLVIGGGGAGLRSAIEARENGARVIVVSKAKVGYGNNTIMSKAILASPGWGDRRDNRQVYLRDTVIGGRYINDQKLVDAMAGEAGREPSILEEYGTSFTKTDNRFSLLAIPGHTYARDVTGKTQTGQDFMVPLKTYAEKKGVEFVDRVFVTRLFASNNRIVAVTGISEQGEFVIFTVKCVIMATGGYSQIYLNTTNTPGINGDGLALAYELGIPLRDMEFVQFYPTASGKTANRLLLYENFLFDGAVLKNVNDENILAKHGLNDPKTITRDLLAQTIFREIMDGFAREGRVTMDLSAVSEERLARYKPMLPRGAAEDGECLVSPTTHHSMGGIMIDPGTRTALPGLFAVGEVCGGMHGANRLAGNALAEIFAMGGIAGRSAAIYAREADMGTLPEDQIERERESLASRFSDSGANSISLIESLKMTMWQRAGIVRNQDDLEKALVQIKVFRSESRKCRIETPKDLMQNIGLRNMLLLAEMVCRSALLRRESRGSHFRSDCPQEDNANWLKNIVIRKESDEMLIDKHPVQMEYVSPPQG